MNWILLIFQQHLLPHETLISTLPLNESFPVSQTPEHVTTYSPRTPFLPHFHLMQVHASCYLPPVWGAFLHVLHVGQTPFLELSFPHQGGYHSITMNWLYVYYLSIINSWTQKYLAFP